MSRKDACAAAVADNIEANLMVYLEAGQRGAMSMNPTSSSHAAGGMMLARNGRPSSRQPQPYSTDVRQYPRNISSTGGSHVGVGVGGAINFDPSGGLPWVTADDSASVVIYDLLAYYF